MKRLQIVPLALALAFAIAIPSSSLALQINWGSAFANLKIIQSDGSELTDPPFKFELGSFGTEFDPTLDNADLWSANWRTFDASDAYLTNGPTDTPPNDAHYGRFGGSADLQSGQTSSSPDSNGTDTFGPVEGNPDRAYIWVYDTETFGPGAEWALFTRMSNGDPESSQDDAWTFPGFVGGQPGQPLSWFLSGADTMIVGGINGIDGPGTNTDPSTDFAIRLENPVAPVPEPTPMFLGVVFGMTSLLWRRRSPRA